MKGQLQATSKFWALGEDSRGETGAVQVELVGVEIS